VGATDPQAARPAPRHYQGFVFQGYTSEPYLALENVELPLIYSACSRPRAADNAPRSSGDVGLKGWESHTPGELSGASSSRVPLPAAIVTERLYCWADEPTGNLDTALKP